ncbi:GGDEF domain-containing protein [Nocardia arthritidis]|uniref:Diguanylate cyclase n=1 Tax=Nocardia arthritidis TaxID=228602 RepID=A0A6G9YP60_9NOCA|nr:GGDEF domain-containing protein [Nocardia arthritidis]QIS15085.1 diguanylate cyclase [Nocardia arthritidis]
MTETESEPTSLPNIGRRCYALLLGGSAAAIGLELFAASPLVSLLTTLAVLGAMLTMIAIGVRRHRPARPLPWCLLPVAALSLATGTVLRDTGGHAVHLLDDAFTLGGYAGFGLAALIWLRPRQVRGNYDMLLDSALIGLSALLASWTFLISPILRTHATTLSTVVAAVYPVCDALLLTLIAHSVATSARSETSLRLLHLGLFAVLVGDFGSSLETVGTAVIRKELLLAPLLLAYTVVGLAALHPTMNALGEPRRIHPHRSRQRASVIAVALIVASLVPVVGARLAPLDRVVVSTLFALLLIGVLVRSERAIARSARSERRAQYQADHDMLTGLLNRSALLRALNRHREPWRTTEEPGADQPLCLLFIDLDGFKMVNDSYGHAVGDELIANAASRIRRVIQRDAMVSRYGGDEFVVLAPLDRPGAALLAERLLAAFVRPFELSAGEIPITASIGLACGSPRSSDATVYDLIRDADSAMYHAKEFSLGYSFHEDIRHAPPTADSGRRIWRRETAV